ncbi:MAG: DUF167 domain-containing protein [Mariprofundaceae bacterium]|nr:DUF167 domain-containing protein [Mariprofundaceae bacterium]
MSASLSYVTLAKKGIYLRIHAQPSARKEGVRGIHGEAIKLAIRAAPEDGKANTAIATFLAKQLGVAKSDVTIVAGHQSRRKRFFINGQTDALIEAVHAMVNLTLKQ